jgi:hypothetical protein
MDVTKSHRFIRFVVDVTKPYKLIGFGAMYVTNPYQFIGFGAMDDSRPYKFIRFGAIDVTKSHICSALVDVTKPYKLYRIWGQVCHQTL